MSLRRHSMRVSYCYDIAHPIIEVRSHGLRLSNDGLIVYKSRDAWRSIMAEKSLNQRGARIRDWLADHPSVFSIFLDRHSLTLQVSVPVGAVANASAIVDGMCTQLTYFFDKLAIDQQLQPIEFALMECFFAPGNRLKPVPA